MTCHWIGKKPLPNAPVTWYSRAPYRLFTGCFEQNHAGGGGGGPWLDVTEALTNGNLQGPVTMLTISGGQLSNHWWFGLRPGTHDILLKWKQKKELVTAWRTGLWLIDWYLHAISFHDIASGEKLPFITWFPWYYSWWAGCVPVIWITNMLTGQGWLAISSLHNWLLSVYFHLDKMSHRPNFLISTWPDITSIIKSTYQVLIWLVCR